MQKIVNKVLAILILVTIILSSIPSMISVVLATTTLYGDVNSDGVVNEKDSLRLKKYLDGECELTEQEIKNADFDNSGSVDRADLLISPAVIRKSEILVIHPPIKLGDLNIDGIIDMKDVTMFDQYIEGKVELEEYSSINADINIDGKVDKYDLEIIRQYITNHDYDSGKDIVIKAVIYGDVNDDGKIDGMDVIRLNKYLNDGALLFIENVLNADLNVDGVVNNYDLRILKEYLAEYDYELMKEPFNLPILCGDVDFDGEINDWDEILLSRYVAKMIDFNNQQLLVADVNLDSVVDQKDITIMQRHLSNWEGYEKLPVLNVDVGNSEVEDLPAIIYGDANCDNSVNKDDVTLISSYVKGDANITNIGKLNADVNLDGNINLLDSNLINLFLESKITLPIIYGELNEDGGVDVGDSGIIMRYVEGYRDLTEQQKVVADVNADGIVNNYDALLIMEFDVGFTELPYIIGDVNNDGKINNRDATKILQYNAGWFEFSKQELILADVNMDGFVNGLDSDIILRHASGQTIALPMIYGDVNEDGKLDSRDLDKINDYLDDKCEFDSGTLYIADVNLNGVVDEKDAKLVEACLNGTIKLPQAFIKDEEVKKDILGSKETISGFEVTQEGIKVSEVAKSFTDNVKTVVYDKNYKEIDESEIVGTGYTVENFYDIEDFANQEYTVVIYGDTTGDGLITPVDALAIIKNRNEKVLFTSEFYNEAGRILTENKEETPTALDALAVIKHLNGKYTINQSK